MPVPPSDSNRDDPATVVAVGVLAATLATTCHETLGHAMACIATQGQVRLLTSIWFRCSKDSAIIDAGGPIGNLVAGSLAVALLSYTRPGPRVRLLLLMLAGLNLFWFTGQLTYESVTHTHEDWFATAVQLGWPPLWRFVGAFAGIAGYVLATRWLCTAALAGGAVRANAIRMAYAAAAACALIAGLMWHTQPFRSAAEGFLCLGIAPLGLLRVARTIGQAVEHDAARSAVARSWIWIGATVVAFGAFLVIQARGLGSMA